MKTLGKMLSRLISGLFLTGFLLTGIAVGARPSRHIDSAVEAKSSLDTGSVTWNSAAYQANAFVQDSLSTAEVDPDPPKKFNLKGYLKYLPSYRNSSALNEPFFDHLIHNRLNARWNIREGINLQGSLRTRYFNGSTVREFPLFDQFLQEDFGYARLNWIVSDGNSHILHTTIDRLFFEYSEEKWQLRVGRQRINWGINLVSNPNDLFNTYSFFDFDYEERPGTDAVRFQYFTGHLSRLELAAAPGRSKEESVAAAYYTFNRSGFDWQFLTGYFRNRWATGLGWAGRIKESGFKGEISYFRDLEPISGREAGNIVAGVSADYLFGNGVFLVVEYLYNQPREGVGVDLLLFTQPLSADNLSFTDHSVFAQARYPISPIISAGLAGFYYPSERAVFLSPSINMSVLTDLDLLIIGQVFRGPENSIFSQAGTLLAAALKWSF